MKINNEKSFVQISKKKNLEMDSCRIKFIHMIIIKQIVIMIIIYH